MGSYHKLNSSSDIPNTSYSVVKVLDVNTLEEIPTK